RGCCASSPAARCGPRRRSPAQGFRACRVLRSGTADGRCRPRTRRAWSCGLRLVCEVMLSCGLDEAVEQRMTVARRRRELRMELACHEPRMIRQLDHLDQLILDRLAGDHEALGFELRAVVVVELEAMTVALADHFGVVERARLRAELEPALLHAEAHGAAEVRLRRALVELA